MYTHGPGLNMEPRSETAITEIAFPLPIAVFVVPQAREFPEELKPLLAEKLKAHILRHLGPVPPPRVFFRERLPRTRSGKILRRLLKAELLGLDPGDTSGLEEDYGAGKAP